MKIKRKLLLLLVLSVTVFGIIICQGIDRGYIDIKGVSPEQYGNTAANTVKEDEASADARGNEDKNNKNTDSGRYGESLSVNNDSRKIKVLITDTGFKSQYHSSIKITCDREFTVETNGKQKKYKAGSTAVFKASDKKLKESRAVVRGSGGAKLKVTSITRQGINPSYRGSMYINYRSSGLLLRNILTIQEYLYAVIPSEMGTGSPMEALKAQAVCARSYAYGQIEAGRYSDFGADVDDSVSCQVYNNVPEDEYSIKAVDATKNRILRCDGKLVSAYYFSTSWGYTANGKDVWGTENNIPYLQDTLQITDETAKESGNINLSSEEKFRDFIDDNKLDTWDSDSVWYRWQVNIGCGRLGKSIYESLLSCYNSDRESVLTRQSDGKYRCKEPVGLGRLKSISVEKRGKSGLVTEIIIAGEKNTVRVCGQYNIRKVLAPVSENIRRRDGSRVSGYSILPSAAFYVDTVSKAGREGFKIHGGGFGHGCGMSQEGAAAMAESGCSYVQILKHYFEGSLVQNVT